MWWSTHKGITADFERRANICDMATAQTTTKRPDRLYYTGIDEADKLLAEDPLALLIGFELDQQVTLQKAFAGPYELRKRIGSLDAAQIASMDAGKLEAAFKERPALHRFPGNMARRTQALCAAIVADYGGDAGAVWRDVSDGKELERRLLGLPGIGEMKARTIIGILGKQFGVQPAGWEALAPQHRSLADADSPEAVAEYQAGKRAYKAQMRAEGKRV